MDNVSALQILHDQSRDGNARGLGHVLVEAGSLHQDPQAATVSISSPYAPQQPTYVFHEHCAFVAGPIPMPESWNQAPRIHL